MKNPASKGGAGRAGRKGGRGGIQVRMGTADGPAARTGRGICMKVAGIDMEGPPVRETEIELGQFTTFHGEDQSLPGTPVPPPPRPARRRTSEVLDRKPRSFKMISRHEAGHPARRAGLYALIRG